MVGMALIDDGHQAAMQEMDISQHPVMSAQEADLQATSAVAPQTKKNIGRDIFAASNTNNLYQDKFTTERMGAS